MKKSKNKNRIGELIVTYFVLHNLLSFKPFGGGTVGRGEKQILADLWLLAFAF